MIKQHLKEKSKFFSLPPLGSVFASAGIWLRAALVFDCPVLRIQEWMEGGRTSNLPLFTIQSFVTLCYSARLNVSSLSLMHKDWGNSWLSAAHCMTFYQDKANWAHTYTLTWTHTHRFYNLIHKIRCIGRSVKNTTKSALDKRKKAGFVLFSWMIPGKKRALKKSGYATQY